MKKKIISFLLAITMILSMSCMGALAADEQKEISVDNIYQITLNNNPNITLISNNIYIMGLSGLYTPSEAASTASTITNLTISKKQIAYGAQQLLLSYYKLLNTKETLEMNIDYMAQSVKVSKVMYEVGMMSKTEYDAVLNKQTELKASLVTLKNNISQVENTLKTMVNAPISDELKIAEFAPVDISVVDTLDREACYAQAMQNNYNIHSSFSSLDSASINMDISENEITETAYDSARITYGNAKVAAQTAFETQWSDIILKRDSVKLAQSKLEVAKTTYDLNKSKYDIGMISKLDFKNAENAYMSAELDYMNAQIDFSATYKKFEALLAGIELSSTGSANAG